MSDPERWYSAYLPGVGEIVFRAPLRPMTQCDDYFYMLEKMFTPDHDVTVQKWARIIYSVDPGQDVTGVRMTIAAEMQPRTIRGRDLGWCVPAPPELVKLLEPLVKTGAPA